MSTRRPIEDAIKRLVKPGVYQDALLRWATFRREIKKQFTLSMLEATLKHYRPQKEHLISDIETAIANGWQGLIWAERLRLTGKEPGKGDLKHTLGRRKQCYRYERHERADGTWHERRVPIEGSQNTRIAIPYKKISSEVQAKLDMIYKKAKVLSE